MHFTNALKKKWILITIICLIGAFVYFYKLGSVPPGLYLDEAGTGYNTYSILNTGMDEYGKSYPAAMRLFGSYSPPFYIYLSVPIMALFDLSVFSTRALSAISGVVVVLVFYLIVKQLKFTNSIHTPIISSLFFALTPWLIFYSRIGYEQNLAFLFFCLSVLLTLKSVKNPKLAALAIPVLSIATYTDYAQRFVAPLLFVGAFLIYRNKLFVKQSNSYFAKGVVIAFIIQIPNILMFFTPSFLTKSDHFYVDVIVSQAQKITYFLPEIIALILSFTRELTSKIFIYFSPKSLFFLPDTDLQRSIPELSTFYSWMVVPYLIGLYGLFNIKNKQNLVFILFLMFLTTLPGALTKEPFHIQRTLPLLLPLSLIITLGFDNLIVSTKPKYALLSTIMLVLVSLVVLWRCYFVLLPQERAQTWGYGFPKLAEYIRSHPETTFVIDQSERTGPKDIAYIQMAFYQKLDPRLLQADQDPKIASDYYNEIDYSFVHSFANMEFKKIDWGESVYKDVVFVGDVASVSDLEVELHNLSLDFEIKDPNEIIMFRGFKSNPTRDFETDDEFVLSK